MREIDEIQRDGADLKLAERIRMAQHEPRLMEQEWHAYRQRANLIPSVREAFTRARKIVARTRQAADGS